MLTRALEQLIGRDASGDMLPHLDVFLEFPVVKTYLEAKGMKPGEVKMQMGSKVFKELVNANLATWKEGVKERVLRLLHDGSPAGKEEETKDKSPIVTGAYPALQMLRMSRTQTTKPDPLKLVTARFNCKRCFNRAPSTFERRVLDFSTVCRHRCAARSEKERRRAYGTAEPWSLEQFEVDVKAVEVTRRALALLNFPEDEAAFGEGRVDLHFYHVENALKEVRYRCGACDGADILLDITALVSICLFAFQTYQFTSYH